MFKDIDQCFESCYKVYMKQLHSYTDYRKYLRDFYDSKKQQSSSFTYALFAKKANLGSANYLQMIIQGRRQLTPATIQQFAKAIPLLGDELNYFESLVLSNQSQTPAERRFYSQRVKEYRSILESQNRSPISRVTETTLITSPLHTAVALILSKKNLEEGPGLAVKALGESEEKIVKIIEQLLESGSLRLDSGFYTLPATHTMASDPKGLQLKQRDWIRGGLEENLSTFEDRYPSGPAKFLNLLCTAPAGSLEELFYDLRMSAEDTVKRHDPLPEQEVGVYRVQVQVYRFHQNES